MREDKEDGITAKGRERGSTVGGAHSDEGSSERHGLELYTIPKATPVTSFHISQSYPISNGPSPT